MAFTANAASLQDASKALDAAGTKTIEFSGAGHWFQFGQAPAPGLPWPQFDVSSYVADINYETVSARVRSTRKQTIEPGRARPTAVEQKADAFVSGAFAWNVAPPAANAPAGTAPRNVPQPGSVEERAAEIWATPQGFVKAALANNAKSEAKGAAVEVSFTLGGKYRFTGTINEHNQLETVRTYIDTPMLGDTLVETKFADYKDFGGVSFPAHILRSEGGHPVLDLAVASVKLNIPVDITVPADVAALKAPAQKVVVNKLADGVYYLTGGTHHSLAIEQKDHVVLVEAPLNEERSLALIAKIKETIPNKPIKYIVNSHVHFDHSGGLRTFVDAGATIVTNEADKPFYEEAWAAPHSLNPYLLEKSKKAPKFETYKDKYVLTDGSRSIEIHKIAGSGHSDELALIYLPAEKILIEADAYTPAAPNAPVPAGVNPYTVNLDENIQRLKLDVVQIAALHGPGVVKLDDLHAAISQSQKTQ
ncbi:MAG: MBL fold metallo-hydrolase [Beijerinckiaceae bacterium]